MESTNSCRLNTSVWISRVIQLNTNVGYLNEFDFILIGNSDGILSNLPRSLKQVGFRTLAIGTPGMYLMMDKYVDQKIEIKVSDQYEFIKEFLDREEYVKNIEGTFLWCDDEIMRKVVSSDQISISDKLRILPIKNEMYLSILGSKVNQNLMFETLSLKTPMAEVFLSKIDFIQKRPNLNKPLLVKSSHGGGGERLKFIPAGQELNVNLLPNEWFPILIQEFIKGKTASVDAFYKYGELKAWMYSIYTDVIYQWGPSLTRSYELPDNKDFLYSLESIGKATKIDGMANVTFILEEETGIHSIIEFDSRPSAWHHSFLDFNIPMKKILQESLQFNPKLYFNKAKVVYEPSRLFNHFLKHRNFTQAFLVILGFRLGKFGKPVSSYFYEIGILRTKFRFLIIWIRRSVIKALVEPGVAFKQKLPYSIRKNIDKQVWLKFILTKILS